MAMVKVVASITFTAMPPILAQVAMACCRRSRLDPFVNTGFNEPPRNDRTRGASVGDVMQAGHEAGLNGKEIHAVICTFP